MLFDKRYFPDIEKVLMDPAALEEILSKRLQDDLLIHREVRTTPASREVITLNF